MNQNSSKLMEDIKKFLTGKKTNYVEIGGHRFAENIKVGQNALVLNGTRRSYPKRSADLCRGFVFAC
ncbi:hypothetical protein [Parasutterella sp.]|uniref:hypothetical protein n=1 Tax=Parasutterella sp. TaxID=2049037 RepID=UPI0035227554